MLVTGASSGIGRAMARVLARDYRANIVVVARRERRLLSLAEELDVHYDTHVDVVVADLARPADVERVLARARELEVDAAVLNAGVTHFGPHLELSQVDFERMLAVNVTSLVRLSTELGRDFVKRGEGAILLVSSIAGLQAVPMQGAYAGTKAFVVGYGRSLDNELAPHGVSVTTFCPGGVRTEMNVDTGLEAAFDSDLLLMSAEVCAKDALRAMVRRRSFRIPGVLNRIGVMALRALPASVATGILGRQYRRALERARAAQQQS